MYAIIVHGGAGSCRPEQSEPVLEGVRAAAEAGRVLLAENGSALDAVIAAVISMEDNPHFNAGTGSVLNLDGEAEMDAGVMVSEGLRTGNVAGLRRVKNPILVAKAVMEETDHVMLAGEGALRFARRLGFPDYQPITQERLAGWRRARSAMLDHGDKYLPHLRDWLRAHPDSPGDTVGAVALDRQGHIAAATSTGGVTLKLSGRVGDSPVPGAGNYACPEAGVSATGKGELMLRVLTAKRVCDRVAEGMSADRAVMETLSTMSAVVGDDVGIIAVDREGGIGVGHLTPAMPYAFCREGAETLVRMGVR